MSLCSPELAASGRSAEELSELLHLVYGAAAHPEEWPQVLRAVTGSLHGKSGVLFTPFLPPQERGIYHALNITAEQSVLWATKYIDQDLWTNRAFERGLVKQGAVITDADTATEDEIRATPIYEALFSKMDIGRFCSGVIFDTSAEGIPVTVLTTHRSFSAPPYSAQDRAWFALLLPHLSRALGLMYRLNAALLQTESVLSALDQLSLGVMLLNSDGQLVHTNNSARRVLARDDGLSCNSLLKLVATPVSADHPALDRWLQMQCALDSVDVNHFADAYFARRKDGREMYAIQCCVMSSPHQWKVQGQGISAIVFVSDPQALVLPESERLIRLYSFTHTQAKVALELARGQSCKEAARSLNVSPETIRTHTKAVYQKMRIQSQADLIRSILTLGHASV